MSEPSPGLQPVQTVRRLEPTKETVRELFAKSGNQCAFPCCPHLIINSEGRFIAQMCHIEAAEKGGERFRESMTNEERRHASNLMLMCYEHHVVTNDVATYPAERLRAIKFEHEAKYTNAVEVIWRSIVDETAIRSSSLAISLRHLHNVLEWELTDDQLHESFVEFDRIQQQIRQLPKQTLQLLVVVVNRGGTSVPIEEIRRVTGLGKSEFISHVETLQRYGIARSDHEEVLQPRIYLCSTECGWFIWTDLMAFCEKTGIQLSDILVDCQFNLLD